MWANREREHWWVGRRGWTWCVTGSIAHVVYGTDYMGNRCGTGELADKTKVGRIVDLFSGCGCLGIIAAHNFPNAEVTLVELDAQAAELAHSKQSPENQ